jgi:hypothetical protein
MKRAMIHIPPEYADRRFQLWQYQVSLGQMLIRSPKSPAFGNEPERVTNVDLVGVGVDCLALPRAFRGLAFAGPTPEEAEQVAGILGTGFRREDLHMLVSEGRRFPIVAAAFRLTENDWDLFETPLQMNPEFRGRP